MAIHLVFEARSLRGFTLPRRVQALQFAAAYQAELSEFVSRVGTGRPLEPGLDAGWKTLLVANVAEASSRQAGRVFELTQQDGRAIESAAGAAAFALASGVV